MPCSVPCLDPSLPELVQKPRPLPGFSPESLTSVDGKERKKKEKKGGKSSHRTDFSPPTDARMPAGLLLVRTEIRRSGFSRRTPRRLAHPHPAPAPAPRLGEKHQRSRRGAERLWGRPELPPTPSRRAPRPRPGRAVPRKGHSRTARGLAPRNASQARGQRCYKEGGVTKEPGRERTRSLRGRRASASSHEGGPSGPGGGAHTAGGCAGIAPGTEGLFVLRLRERGSPTGYTTAIWAARGSSVPRLCTHRAGTGRPHSHAAPGSADAVLRQGPRAHRALSSHCPKPLPTPLWPGSSMRLKQQAPLQHPPYFRSSRSLLS